MHRIVLALAFAGVASAAEDAFLGEWLEDISKYSVSPASRLVIAEEQGGFRFTDVLGSYVVPMDGKQHPHSTPERLVSLSRVDERTLERRVVNKADGKQTTLATMTLSDDGQSLTQKTIGGGFNGKFKRGGGSGSGFAGEWVQDYSGRTPARLVLTKRGDIYRFERTDGSGGPYKATTRLDGAPVQWEREQPRTLKLRRIDSHTLEELFENLNGIKGRGEVKVSADGKMLTDIDTYTNAAGRDFTTTIVFRKQ